MVPQSPGTRECVSPRRQRGEEKGPEKLGDRHGNLIWSKPGIRSPPPKKVPNVAVEKEGCEQAELTLLGGAPF